MSRVPRPRADVQVLTEIGVISQLTRNRLERTLPEGLSQAQFNLLIHLAHSGGEQSPAQLAQAFQVTKGAMTNSLQRLEAQGFVNVVGDSEDGRRKRVSITPAGLAAHDLGVRAARPAMDALRTRFSDADFAAALPFLSALKQWLDENR